MRRRRSGMATRIATTIAIVSRHDVIVFAAGAANGTGASESFADFRARQRPRRYGHRAQARSTRTGAATRRAVPVALAAGRDAYRFRTTRMLVKHLAVLGATFVRQGGPFIATPRGSVRHACAPTRWMCLCNDTIVGRCCRRWGRRDLDSCFLHRVCAGVILISDVTRCIAAFVNRLCVRRRRADDDQQQCREAAKVVCSKPIMREGVDGRSSRCRPAWSPRSERRTSANRRAAT